MKRITQLTILLATLTWLPAVHADKAAGKDGTAAKEETATSAPKEESFDVEVKLTGNDQMQYDKKAFTVSSGQKVKLIFQNVGKLPKVAMGHNVVILKKGVNKVTFATSAITAGPAAGYLPTANKGDVLAHTQLLGPAEEETIFFTAPEPGTYDYICTFPGHFALMSGVMTVK